MGTVILETNTTGKTDEITLPSTEFTRLSLDTTFTRILMNTVKRRKYDIIIIGKRDKVTNA